MKKLLIFSQIVVLAILLTSDLIPLGNLNDMDALREELSLGTRLLGTGMNGGFVLLALFLTIKKMRTGELGKLGNFYFYAFWPLFFLGQMINWWFPYLLGTPAALVEQIRVLTADTLIIFPEYQGRLAPNFLHCVLHLFTLIVNVIVLRLGLNR